MLHHVQCEHIFDLLFIPSTISHNILYLMIVHSLHNHHDHSNYLAICQNFHPSVAIQSNYPLRIQQLASFSRLMKTIFHKTIIGCPFLQYLLYIQSLHIYLVVMKVHHNLQNKSIEILGLLLNHNPSSSCGKHTSFQFTLCLPFSPIQLL